MKTGMSGERFCLPRWEAGLYIGSKTGFKAVSEQSLRLL